MKQRIYSVAALVGALIPIFWTEADMRSPQASVPKKEVNFIVYSVNHRLPMGNETKEDKAPLKDYYVNMGTAHGVKKGAILEVRRKISSYDLVEEQLYRDLFIPVAQVRVIHVEPLASVVRLEQYYPQSTTPLAGPRSVMVGDLVRDTGMYALTKPLSKKH